MPDTDYSRRKFLGQATSLAAAMALGVKSMGAQSDKPLVIGTGNAKYSVHHDWLTPPEGMLFGDTHGVAQDAKGHIYVAHTVHPDSKSSDAIAVYDKHGKFLTSWG